MAGTENASSALAVWNALKPKIRQLIRDETRSAVRKKKMTIQSIDTANQSVTVYEAANPNVTLTLQYRKESGVGAMSAGQSVTVEWIYDDLSTAVVSGPGQGWSTNTLDAETAGEMFISSNNPQLIWKIGTDGSAVLRRNGSSGSYAVSFVTKATSSSSNVFNVLINSDGSRNWALKSEIPTMATKALSNQTTSTAGSIDLGLTTSAAAVLGCANSSYIMIPFVNSGGWRVRAIDNAGNRVVSTNVGTVTVYYLAL